LKFDRKGKLLPPDQLYFLRIFHDFLRSEISLFWIWTFETIWKIIENSKRCGPPVSGSIEPTCMPMLRLVAACRCPSHRHRQVPSVVQCRPAFLVLSHEDVKGGLWEPLRLAPLILLPLILSYDDLLALGRLGLRWLNQDLIPVELDHVHVCQEWVFVEIHLMTLYKFQLSVIYVRLNPSMENITIVSSMRIRIMSFTISIPFELF
jgi:hypothetical protein